MIPYEDWLSSTTAASVTDISNGVVLVLSACFMLVPFVMLAGLLYSGIRNRRLRNRESGLARNSDDRR